VTGASGFIGSRACGGLAELGYEVHAVGRRPSGKDLSHWHCADLLEDDRRRRLVAEVAPSHLLHLAWYAEPGAFWTAPENTEWVAATIRLAQEFAAAGGRRAVFAGTCAEYDWSVAGRCSEADTPLRPATLYGVCKDATRRVVERVGVDAAWGRVFFLYGPGEDPRRLVASVARSLVAGEQAATSHGRQLRDFLHVDDVADAFVRLVDSDVTGAVNVGSGEGVPILRVVELLAEAAGRPDLLDVGALPARPDDPDELVADVGRLRDELGWRPTRDLAEGLAETVAWWRERSGSE
jgi:nucleoside-diphosphate-sugar epimerase